MATNQLAKTQGENPLSISQKGVQQAISYGLNDRVHARLPKPLAVCLRSKALAEKTDTSTLVRVLLTEALEARGINWLTDF